MQTDRRALRMAVLDTAFNFSEFTPNEVAAIHLALGRCARLRVHFRELFTDADLRRPPSGDAAHVAGHPDLRRFRTGHVLFALLDEGVPVPPGVLARVLECQPSVPRAWLREM